MLGAEPDNYRVHYYLGTVYSELTENDKATKEFEKIPEGSEHYVESRLQLAYLYDKQKRVRPGAYRARTRRWRRSPTTPRSWASLVGVYQEKKDYPTAIELAQADGRAGSRKNDKYHFTLGALYDENKQKRRRYRGDAQGDRAQSEQRAGAQLPRLHLRRRRQPPRRGREADQARARIEPEDGFYVDSLGWVYYQQGRVQQSGRASSSERST